MDRTSIRRAASIAAAAALGLSLAACSGDDEPGAGSDGGSGSGGAGLSGTLNGGGASSQEAAMAAFRAGFQTANPETTINYAPEGSGTGREQFIAGAWPFAGTDAFLDDEELAGATETCGGDPIEVPNYISPIAIVYNLDGVDDLRLSPDTLAGIFTGAITRWDDDAIAADNPSAELPDSAINPVHRSDDSGTSENFTAYLAAVAPEVWTSGETGEWPGDLGGEGASGTSGVIAAVTNGPGSIGYADASQAAELSHALVKVGDDFVGPSAEAAAKVVEVSPRVEGRPTNSMAVELDRDTAESAAYPIVLVSYLLLCPTYDDAETAVLVKSFAGYVVSADGQQAAAQAAGSAPLSDTLADEAAALIESIG